MLRLKQLDLTKVVSFKQASVKIEENNGFVVVRGMNYDSNIADNSNGAGKSLLWSALPTLAYESDPLSLTKKNKKDLHTEKGSTISATITDETGKEIRLEQIGAKYKFYIDGEDQKAQTGDIAKGLFAKHWPLLEEEFYTTAYIQSQRTCAFQKAKPSDRLKFITNLFDLHVYDQLRAHFSKKLQAIKDKEIEFGTLTTQLEKVERSLAEIDWSKSSAKRLKQLKADVEKSRSVLGEAYEKRNFLAADIKATKKALMLLKDLSESSSELKPLGDDLDKLAKQLEAQARFMDKLADYEEDLAEYESKVKKLKDRQSELRSALKKFKLPKKYRKYSIPKIKDTLDKLSDAFSDVKSELKELDKTISEQDEIESEIAELEESLSELGFDSIAAVDMDTDVSDEISMLKTVIELADDLSDHSECPTCLQSINSKKLIKQAKVAKKKLPELQDLKKAQSVIRKLEEVLSEKSDVKALRKKASTLSKDKDRIKEESSLLTDYESLLMDIEHIKGKLESYNAPKKPKGEITFEDLSLKQVDDLLDTLDEQSKLVSKLDQQLSSIFALDGKEAKRLVKKSKYSTLRKNLKALQAKLVSDLEECSDQIDEIDKSSRKSENEYIALKTAKGNWQLLTEQQMELEAKLEKSRPIIAEKKIIETLYNAYGNTNLKLQQATKILKIVESNLNKFSHMVFPETMRFSLESGTRGIDAIVTRQNGKASDVSKLSGAETNCFRLLFAISVLPLIPAHRRTNFMVLDEPDSACSEAVREHLAKEFIPKLRSLVPHVFWITPKPIDIFSECELWTVEKKNGVSSINMSHIYEEAE